MYVVVQHLVSNLLVIHCQNRIEISGSCYSWSLLCWKNESNDCNTAEKPYDSIPWVRNGAQLGTKRIKRRQRRGWFLRTIVHRLESLMSMDGNKCRTVCVYIAVYYLTSKIRVSCSVLSTWLSIELFPFFLLVSLRTHQSQQKTVALKNEWLCRSKCYPRRPNENPSIRHWDMRMNLLKLLQLKRLKVLYFSCSMSSTDDAPSIWNGTYSTHAPTILARSSGSSFARLHRLSV